MEKVRECGRGGNLQADTEGLQKIAFHSSHKAKQALFYRWCLGCLGLPQQVEERQTFFRMNSVSTKVVKHACSIRRSYRK